MANLVMGAMGNIVPKLYKLLKEEYKLQTDVKERIRCLTKELEVAQAVLHKVSEVPWDQLDKQVQLWTCEIREASYDMEDVLDTFFVRVQGPGSAEEEQSLLGRLKKTTNIFKKSKARRKISGNVKDIMSHLQEVTERCRRYKVEDIVGRPAATTYTIDPRLHAMYIHVDKLVGINESSGELKSMLQLDDMSNMKMKTVSIVGIGGLGKTTIAKAVYDNLRGDFNCRAFVSVGKNPDLQKVLQMILIAIDKKRYEKFNFSVLQDITQFIDKLRDLVHQNKRYFIVIDDLWEKRTWETLKLAIAGDKNCEGRIIITTRNWEVAKNADEVYELPALPPDSSRKLFYTRIYGDERNYVDYQPDEVSDEILRKCAGIPLAIITMASLLVDEPMDRWFEVYKSIGFGCKDNESAENTMKILSFSYYDLPPHLRTCLLYLSAFPEDSFIPKASLVWMWVAEGFIQGQKGKGLFEMGQDYFNVLVNRSMIQEVEPDYDDLDRIQSCRVHDMVLDFIRSMSCEENFFTVFDNNDQGTLVGSNVVRRLAHHNKITGHSSHTNMLDMSKVRSLIALEWVIDTWAPLRTFKLLRVLSIGTYGKKQDGSHLRVEHLAQLIHLRFLGINGRRIKKIPEEIGSLKVLQTLDLFESFILELPSSSSLPTQLVCLRIVLNSSARDTQMFSVGRLTSLEQLSIKFSVCNKASRRLVKELGNLRELRVLDLWICLEDEQMDRDLIDSVHHLDKLQHLKIGNYDSRVLDRRPEMDFVLSGDLRYLIFDNHLLWKLPSCIDTLCHRKLSHLDLRLQYMDEHELKTLGGLPELRFLGLNLPYSSPTIRNINDSDASYFPKLRCFRLKSSMVLFVANKDEKQSISFHLWNGRVDDRITRPHSVSGSELQGDHKYSSVFQCQTGRGPVAKKSDEELLLLSPSDDVDARRLSFQPSKLQHRIAMPLVSYEEKKEGTISTREGEGQGAAAPRFMPRLQVLHFHIPLQAIRDHSNCCDNLGLEFLSSLSEIHVRIEEFPWYAGYYQLQFPSSVRVKEVKAALRSAAQVHLNHPTLRIY